MCDDNDTTAAAVRVEFRLPAALGATTATVVGDFNGWDAHADVMRREEDGGFVATKEIQVGRSYRYRYLIDAERWENDWDADDYARNMFGGDDSVLDLTPGSRRLAAAVPASPRAAEPSPGKGAESEREQPVAKRSSSRKRVSGSKPE
ncbi:MAG: glycoside hydrolase family 13 domain protein [Ilumatobacteraceae bacterium]|nr:glycoside hydrolase family 13 domain protein [Ilumatobacteraceae bacterium]